MDFLLGTLLLCLVSSWVSLAASQLVEGCPSYGCNPRGTFSLRTPIPLGFEVCINWTAPLGYPLSEMPGCVVNHGQNIICPVNTSTPDIGYASYNVFNGSVIWKDKVFNYPTLPLLDSRGNVIGSDGEKLALITDSGKVVDPVIKFTYPLKPIYSLMLSDNDMMLIVSEAGMLLTYGLDGIVDASMFLNATINGVKGSYNAIAQPVLQDHRAYILTRFVPENVTDRPKVQSAPPRLFAVDIQPNMVPRLNVTWFIDMAQFPEKRVPEEKEKKRWTESDFNSVYRETEKTNEWSDVNFNMFDQEQTNKMDDLGNDDENTEPYYTPRVLTSNGHVFVIMQDWHNATWNNFYDIIDNRTYAKIETDFALQTADDISADDSATPEHGYYVWLYSRRTGAITTFEYITKNLSDPTYLENVFMEYCNQTFTSNLMVVTPQNATDRYRFVVGMHLPQDMPSVTCKIYPRTKGVTRLNAGSNYIMTLEQLGYNKYDVLHVENLGDFAVRGQIGTFYAVNGTDVIPMMVAVAEDPVVNIAIVLNIH